MPPNHRSWFIQFSTGFGNPASFQWKGKLTLEPRLLRAGIFDTDFLRPRRPPDEDAYVAFPGSAVVSFRRDNSCLLPGGSTE